jgi:DEAD/DEAH box helicase domain-containing protein
MIPSALSTQLERGLADFLRFSFWSTTPHMDQVVDDLLAAPGSLTKGPYLSLKLPFVKSDSPPAFPNVPLGFPAHAHQDRAFERLGGRRKRSTLVATGTGSGKTECFLIPIVDHCLREFPKRGVKAILIYPMNALATDQAARLAKLIHRNDKLRGKVRAGLYIGETVGKRSATDKTMGEKTVITDRETMQLDPPDILLTNYKMLDYLLLRPSDQAIWQHNQRGLLRYLVVDEIHTFDGAQGTDLACLTRRLKRRLQVDDGSLCCVGTSATLGGLEAATQLRSYAEDVFGESFDEHSVIGEARQSEAFFLAGTKAEIHETPDADVRARLDPATATDPDTWLDTQVRLWLGEDTSALPGRKSDPDAWAVWLGEQLRRHASFRALLGALGGQTRTFEDLVAILSQSRSSWRDDPQLGRLALASLLGLVSAARAWSEELPEERARREAAGESRPTRRFVDMRLQLWQRELRRMVATVEPRPRLHHFDDLDIEARRRCLPLVHCRDCGSMGWATRYDADRPHALHSELNPLYRAFFAKDPRVQFLYPREAVPTNDKTWEARPVVEAELVSLRALGPEQVAEGPTMELVRVRSVRKVGGQSQLTRDCPFCGAHESLALLGSRAASLTSVYIDQLFASRFNDDKKLLTFSDSVQDAAHRAGFFGARTWRTNLRMAMLQLIRDREGISLAELAAQLGPAWRQRLDPLTWASTFLAPNMTWLREWEALMAKGTEIDNETRARLERMIDERLAFEVQGEFGLEANIGRSLQNTETVAVAIAPERLERAIAELLELLRSEVPGLRELEAPRLRYFILGLLTRLRTRGGILSSALPARYVESFGDDIYVFKQSPHLPGFAKTSRLPALLVDRKVHGPFETWVGKTSVAWYARWVERSLDQGKVLGADADSLYPVLLPGLVAAGLLVQTTGGNDVPIWGIDPAALKLTRAGARVSCTRCKAPSFIAEAELESWLRMRCLSSSCAGHYDLDQGRPLDYFGRLYAHGDLQRIFAAEHTGLLDRTTRVTIEEAFKAETGKPWDPNLLSCTPTLEMGIDIGDLSTTILCSVPPRQASYLQRIGRAGRRDGNSLILTVANARNHDNYFYARPEEMMDGEVPPPGVFLDAAAVLQRQLTAFCFDQWVVEAGAQAELPSCLRDVFGGASEGNPERFPANLVAFIETHRPRLLREFEEMFAGVIGEPTRAHLERFLGAGAEDEAGVEWTISNILETEKKQRDSLANKARALQKQIKQLEQREAKPLDWEKQLEQFEAEKDALLALVKAINGRRTLEFLTEQGLLPNYAFPESAVRLNSVIWRKRQKPAKDGSKFETWHYEYVRAPASAISELAPNAEFYAGGRRVRIDQVDVSVSEIETWRFCDMCDHAQRIDAGDETATCPACGSGNWGDDGQKLRMLPLRQVFANSPDRESRIVDDQDDRRPRFFQRQVLVDTRDEDRAGAWVIDDPVVPFGFEFLHRATFREINFGEYADNGPQTKVAGRDAVRPGFPICTRCGKVQTKDEPVHSFSCPSAKKGAKPTIEPCLYLYRQFTSEALRLLLPAANTSTRELNSFVAALQAGLQLRFGGSIEHLRTTVHTEPISDSTLRKQYLVLFDTVPGGTGYLSQLVTAPEGGGGLPLFEAMALALSRIEGCPCWTDPKRDGCYRCIYAYRSAQDMDDTSAKTASELLRKILKRVEENKLEQVESLGKVSISGLLDSVLEVRFLEAMRAASHGGETARLKRAVINGKPGYRWALGEAEWSIEPQVETRVGQGDGIFVSIDFVLRPASARSQRKPIAVFLDGWTYHKDRIGKDLRQRMALLATGRWDVWTLTWADLDEALFGNSTQTRANLLVTDADKLEQVSKGPISKFAPLFQAPLFAVFQRDLLEELPWLGIAGTLLTAKLGAGAPTAQRAWRELVGEVAPEPTRAGLRAIGAKLAAHETDASGLFRLMAIHDGSAFSLLTTFDDRPVQRERPEFKNVWYGYLRLFQMLRAIPNAWFMTHEGCEVSPEYQPIWLLRQGAQQTATWSELDDIDDAFRSLAEALMAAGIDQPTVGLELPDEREDTWGEAELAWESERVAIVSARAISRAISPARRKPHPSWTVLELEALAGNPAPVLAALAQAETN